MAEQKPKIVALIPARANSKRVSDKNVRPLAGHPLIAYTIAAALEMGTGLQDPRVIYHQGMQVEAGADGIEVLVERLVTALRRHRLHSLPRRVALPDDPHTN